MESKITSQRIDDAYTTGHKLCQHLNVEKLVADDKRHATLYSMIHASYIESMEFVKYRLETTPIP